MKKLNRIVLLILLTTLSFSCEKEDSELTIEKNNTENSKLRLGPLCHLIGPESGCKNEIVNYTMDTDIENPIFEWSVLFGNINTNIAGQGTNTASFQLQSNFGGGVIRVEVTSSTNSDHCTFDQNISLCDTDGEDNGNCSCPTPFIDDRVCVSGGHPYWRFEVENIQSGDQIRWYTQHATILSGNGTSYIIINPNSSAIHGFTVYCEITRVCSNGTIKKRTAFYENYYGGSCGNGTTGYIDNCDYNGLD